MGSAQCGVYAITNRFTGEQYIGSSVNIEQRWLAHRSGLRTGRHCNGRLQRAWDTHSESAFVVDILEAVSSDDELLEAEQRWIDSAKPAYNMKLYAARKKRGYLRFGGNYMTAREAREYMGISQPQMRELLWWGTIVVYRDVLDDTVKLLLRADVVTLDVRAALLEATNARRARHGHPPLTKDAWERRQHSHHERRA